MKRNGRLAWLIVPALLIVFLVAAMVTFLGEPKSRFTRESWKSPTAFAVETPHQVVGIAHRTVRAQTQGGLRIGRTGQNGRTGLPLS